MNRASPDSGETPLHAALCKTTRWKYTPVLRILLAAADPNRARAPGIETGSFMRDARTKGGTPSHRAAAFGKEEAIRLLLDKGPERRAWAS